MLGGEGRGMPFQVVKSSGRQETFDLRKLRESLVRSGAPADVAGAIAKQVAAEIAPLSRTRDIYRLAKKLLRKYNAASGMRYSLKKAIFALGPSGFPFERYFARILSSYGYTAEVGKTMKGECVSHEVDVIAKNGNEHALVECKYHSSGGKATDVKVALYVHARFLDIRTACKKKEDAADDIHQCWLVTNTRCTSDAIRYAECAGIRIVSWRYPREGSLEQMIEQQRLYPVTILPAARKTTVDTLFRTEIVLAQDIADMETERFIEMSGIEPSTARLLKKQADEICPCNHEASSRRQSS